MSKDEIEKTDWLLWLLGLPLDQLIKMDEATNRKGFQDEPPSLFVAHSKNLTLTTPPSGKLSLVK